MIVPDSPSPGQERRSQQARAETVAWYRVAPRDEQRVLTSIAAAIARPYAYTGRRTPHEPMTIWQARAVLAVLHMLPDIEEMGT